MDAQKKRRILRARTARETTEAIKHLNLRNNPTLEEIARFHDLHARHERRLDHEANARAAEQRARHARAILAKRP